jgi:hypothetical protein
VVANYLVTYQANWDVFTLLLDDVVVVTDLLVGSLVGDIEHDDSRMDVEALLLGD